MNVDDQTGKDLAERMEEFHAKAVTVGSEAEAIMGNAQLDVKPPVMVNYTPT